MTSSDPGTSCTWNQLVFRIRKRYFEWTLFQILLDGRGDFHAFVHTSFKSQFLGKFITQFHINRFSCQILKKRQSTLLRSSICSHSRGLKSPHLRTNITSGNNSSSNTSLRRQSTKHYSRLCNVEKRSRAKNCSDTHDCRVYLLEEEEKVWMMDDDLLFVMKISFLLNKFS